MSVATSITVRVPLTIRRWPGRKTVVTPGGRQGGTVMPSHADPALVKAMARAFRYQRLLDRGHYASVSEMAAAEKIERGYLGTLLRLTLLAPDIVEAILDGRQPDGVSLSAFMGPFPLAWAEQVPTSRSPAAVRSRTPAKPRVRRRPDAGRPSRVA